MKKKILGLLIFTAMLFAACSFSVDTQKAVPSENSLASTVLQKRSLENVDSSFPYAPKKEDIVDGCFIVKTKDDFDQTLFEQKGFTVDGSISLVGTGFTYWYLNKEGNNKKNLMLASSVEGVLFAEYDYKVEGPDGTKVLGKTEDGAVSVSGLTDGDYLKDPVANNADYGLSITEALKAYKEFGYGSNTVVAGIIDTGINMKHKDFYDESGNSIVLYAKSCATKSGTYVGDGKPFTEIPIGENWDRGEHGTHCSGTICARGDNNVGIAGVAWKNTKLISYQSLGAEGSGKSWSVYGAMADLINTVNILRKPKSERTEKELKTLPSYLKDTDFQITQTTVPVNMSLGGPVANEFAFTVLTHALKNNILPVIAMGNEGRYTAAYPAAFPGMLAVGATDGNDKKVHFSTKGAWISVSAPGYGIKSCGVYGEDDYESMSGTSMATPFVTGVISYLLSFDRAHNLTPYQIKTLIEKTADKVDGASSFSESYGHGRVNVYKAAKDVSLNKIPEKNDVYSEGSVTVTIKNGDRVMPPKIGLIDEVTQAPLLYISGTDGRSVKFKGLIKGRMYSVYGSFLGSAQKHTFTAEKEDEDIVLQFNKKLAWVSTVPNLYYNNGKDQTDTVILVFKADDQGNLESSTPILSADDYGLDTVYFAYEPEAKYYVTITGYLFPQFNKFLGGNYAIKIGEEPLNPDGESIKDKDRDDPNANDTHENDDDLVNAKAKGNAWNIPMGCNLVPHITVDKNQIDLDTFYIEAPEGE